ncbi:hypothetical protein VTI74DRAFT_3362 [Chaetomium olivicolor]
MKTFRTLERDSKKARNAFHFRPRASIYFGQFLDPGWPISPYSCYKVSACRRFLDLRRPEIVQRARPSTSVLNTTCCSTISRRHPVAFATPSSPGTDNSATADRGQVQLTSSRPPGNTSVGSQSVLVCNDHAHSTAANACVPCLELTTHQR